MATNMKLVEETHKRVQQAAHIMGGSSSSISQKGFFPGGSFTSLFLSSTLSLAFLSTLCLSNSVSTLQILAAAGLGAGVSVVEQSGSITSELDGLGIFKSPSCWLFSWLSVRPAHLQLESADDAV